MLLKVFFEINVSVVFFCFCNKVIFSARRKVNVGNDDYRVGIKRGCRVRESYILEFCPVVYGKTFVENIVQSNSIAGGKKHSC